jgi:hypothetical protein
VFRVFTSCCLVAASNGGRSPSSGFPNCPRPQLPASHFTQLQLSNDSSPVHYCWPSPAHNHIFVPSGLLRVLQWDLLFDERRGLTIDGHSAWISLSLSLSLNFSLSPALHSAASLNWPKVRVKSYFMTGGLPPISSSWRQAPWDSRSVVLFAEHLLSYSLRNILSDERMGLPFTIAAGSRQRSHSQIWLLRILDHILLSQIRDSPDLEGQSPVFISPRNRVVRLYPQALGSLFIASYDSQGYGGGIWTRLHTALSFSLNWLNY